VRSAILPALLLALSAASGAWAQGGPEAPGAAAATLLQTSHRGAVLAIEHDEGRGLVFTAGEDGTLRVWDLAARAIVARIGIGRLPLTAIAVNPAATQVAVLESDGVHGFAVSAWDWRAARRLFRVTLAGEPLFLRYSGAGSWLMLGESAWQGLRLLAAADGSPVAFHPEGFGIVGFAEVSRSERTILTYQPSGRLQYWEAATGNLVTELRIAPYLSGLRISRDRRYAAGSDGREVLLVDLVTGATRARLELAGVRSLDLSPAADEIACIAPSAAGALELSRWTLSGDTFSRLTGADRAAVTMARYTSTGLVSASADGIGFFTASAETVVLARDELADITGVAADGGLLALASPRWIWLLRQPEGSGPASGVSTVPNPLGGPTGLVFVEGRLVAWRQGPGSPAAVTLDVGTGAVTGTPAGLAAPLLQLEPASGSLVSLDRTGTVRLVALPGTAAAGDAGRPLFDAWLPGTLCVVAISDRELVGGRTPIGASGGGGGTLLRINMRTGETVAVPGNSRSTYDLAWDAARGTLYSLGVDAAGDTVLTGHGGPGFEGERVLARYEDEDLSAALALDPATGTVYASLGFGGIVAWDGSSAGLIASEGRVPRRLAAAPGLLASVNRDSAVSLWDPATRALAADLYLLASGDWCQVGAGGRWSASDGAAPLVRVTVEGALVVDPSAWRLQP
jgi:hypothetical protein